MAFDTLYALDATPFAKGKEGVCVFGATRLADGERVAVKVFPLPPLPLAEAEARVAIDTEFAVREMLRQRAAPLADHPHLVPSYCLHYVDPAGPRVDGEPPVRALLVLGLARGKSAEHRLGGGTFDFAGGNAHGGGGGGGGGGVDPLFSPAETVSVAYCLASALAHLHAHGALHYDVKPANTLFFDGDHVPPRARSARLADFGEARMKRDGTTTGGKRGTDAFMAPEVMNNMRALRARCKEGADIWSLGATLFALLTGRELGKSEDLLDELDVNPQSEQGVSQQNVLDVNHLSDHHQHYHYQHYHRQSETQSVHRSHNDHHRHHQSDCRQSHRQSGLQGDHRHYQS
jgi:serine/threonine protein kinase